MADLRPLTLRERNDEVLVVTVTPDDPAEDLDPVVRLVVVLKPDACYEDDDPAVVTLTSTEPDQVLIGTRDATHINATVYIPASALVGSYARVWRCDAYTATGTHRTALYGPVTVVPL